MVMAIRRCPYCKAIIDEQDKYCNNCGTQLLFPEDEYVEEEIPGDKIIDDDDDDDEEEEELVEEELEEAASIEEEEEEEEDDEEEEEKEGKISADLEKTKEEKEHREGGGTEDEKMAKEKEAEVPAEEEEPEEELEEPEEDTDLIEEDEDEYVTSGEVLSEEEEIEEEEGEEDEDLEEPEEEDEEEEEIREQRLVPSSEEDAAKKYQVSIEEDELVFKTKDLESLTGAVDEGKENLEELLETYQEKSEEGEKPISDTGEDLPPWVSGMKGGEPPGELEEEREEEAAEEVETERPPTRPEWATDSGVGIPERVTQSGLPFADTTAQAAGEEHEMATEEDVVKEGEAGPETRRRLGFSLKLKAKLADLVFITALWLIALWFTSQVIGVSFFRLIAGSPGPVLAFYFILLLLYFFLFLYFLGETLGDHFFSEAD
jgi:hypothetical protein